MLVHRCHMTSHEVLREMWHKWKRSQQLQLFAVTNIHHAVGWPILKGCCTKLSQCQLNKNTTLSQLFRLMTGMCLLRSQLNSCWTFWCRSWASSFTAPIHKDFDPHFKSIDSFLKSDNRKWCYMLVLAAQYYLDFTMLKPLKTLRTQLFLCLYQLRCFRKMLLHLFITYALIYGCFFTFPDHKQPSK